MILIKDLGRLKMVEIIGVFHVEEIFKFRRERWHEFSSDSFIFSLKDASFIGSSGLVPLLRDLDNLGAQRRSPVVLVGVKAEVRRLIMGLKLNHFKIYEDLPEALSDCLKT
ncbi:MAG: STAS domain-containing protein [Bdellovibrionaceae bacterium]|nr:STAS domain-containing protein [Pseudobdellovibrionaceae bacterium]MDW8190039.1 hypothetical protein [Pseudobdellovibrionaceae bacterium]